MIRAIACVLALSSVACVHQEATHTAQQAQAMKEEESADKLVDRGKAFAALGDGTRAEQYLSGAIEKGADAKKVLPMLLKVCISEQRYRVAIEYAEPYLRAHPDDVRLRFVVGTLYRSIGDLKSARAELETVMKQMPTHAEAHLEMARLLREDDKEPLKADEHFREYVRLKPDGAYAAEARQALLKSVGDEPLHGAWKTIPQPASPAAAPKDARP